MKHKLPLLLVGFLAIFTSCKKVNSNTDIIGTWLRTHQTTEYNGQTYEIPINSINTIRYDSCEGNDEWCPAENINDGNSNHLEYQISEDSETLTTRNLDGSQEYSLSIIELNSSTLEVSISQQGSTTVITYDKQ